MSRNRRWGSGDRMRESIHREMARIGGTLGGGAEIQCKWKLPRIYECDY